MGKKKSDKDVIFCLQKFLGGGRSVCSWLTPSRIGRMQDPNEDTEWNDILRAKGIIPEKTVTEDDIVQMVDATVKARVGDGEEVTRAFPLFQPTFNVPTPRNLQAARKRWGG